MLNPEYLIALSQGLKEIVNSDATKYAIQTISAVKEKRDDKKTIEAYEEIFNTLINENQELKRIALGYKEEYENLNISDKDIEYLQATATRLTNLLFPNLSEKQKTKLLNNTNTEEEKQQVLQRIKQVEEEQANYSMLIDFIQVDTLRTMQLLGFNYKKAIGEPLTKICSDKIYGMSNSN